MMKANNPRNVKSSHKLRLLTQEDDPSILFNAFHTQAFNKLSNYLENLSLKESFRQDFNYIQEKHKVRSRFKSKKITLIDHALKDIRKFCLKWKIPVGLDKDIYLSMLVSNDPVIVISDPKSILGCRVQIGVGEYPVVIEISDWATGKDIKDFVNNALPYIKAIQKKYGDQTNQTGKLRKKNKNIQKIYNIVHENIDKPLKEITRIIYNSGIEGAKEKTYGDVGKIRSLIKKNRN